MTRNRATLRATTKREKRGRAAMHTQFLAGVVFAWVVSYIGIGLSFCIAYSIHKREPEHLLFGLHSLALAVYSTGLTLGYTYVSELDARFAVRIAVGGAILA